MNRFFLAALLTMSSLSYAGTGFKTGEQISGFNKICYYDGASGAFSKTVSSISLCPAIGGRRGRSKEAALTTE